MSVSVLLQTQVLSYETGYETGYETRYETRGMKRGMKQCMKHHGIYTWCRQLCFRPTVGVRGGAPGGVTQCDLSSFVAFTLTHTTPPHRKGLPKGRTGYETGMKRV